MKTTGRYFPRVLIPIVVFRALAVMSAKVMDAGEAQASFRMAGAAYIVLISPILLRRLRQPTSTDLHLITWALPGLFILALSLIDEASRLPRLRINWGIVARLWENHGFP
jgi:hypothetical protein